MLVNRSETGVQIRWSQNMKTIRMCARWTMLVTASIGLFASTPSAYSQEDGEPPRPVLDEQGVPQVRFNFKNQTWDQVLDYFSRVTGLPIVRDATCRMERSTTSTGAVSASESAETLNLLLQTRGLVLRDEDGRLVLEELSQIKKENIPTFVGNLPDDLTADTLVTLIVPLVNATAANVSEQLKEMVAEYGMVVALPEQNSLLLVETLQTFVAFSSSSTNLIVKTWRTWSSRSRSSMRTPPSYSRRS